MGSAAVRIGMVTSLGIGILTFGRHGAESRSPPCHFVEGGARRLDFARGGKRTVHGVQQTADGLTGATIIGGPGLAVHGRRVYRVAGVEKCGGSAEAHFLGLSAGKCPKSKSAGEVRRRTFGSIRGLAAPLFGLAPLNLANRGVYEVGRQIDGVRGCPLAPLKEFVPIASVDFEPVGNGPARSPGYGAAVPNLGVVIQDSI
jgi:hypothetical protein